MKLYLLRMFWICALAGVASCGDGINGLKENSGSGSTSATSFKYIFVTSSQYDGNLGGASGADTKCNSDSNRPVTTVTYKALLVTTSGSRRACSSANCSGGASEHVDWVLSADTQYRRADGITVIGTTNSIALFSLPLTNSIDSDTGKKYWTGFNSGGSFDWTAANGANTCTSYTDNTGGGGANGKYGMGNSSNGAMGESQDWCNTSTTRIACVEQ